VGIQNWVLWLDGQSELGAAVLLKAVWWDLRLAGLLMHLFCFLSCFIVNNCRYYSGEKKAPVLTVFIGGNHEASNYLQELPYGGWVAPNIYYLGEYLPLYVLFAV